jgi:transcriptional regulator
MEIGMTLLQFQLTTKPTRRNHKKTKIVTMYIPSHFEETRLEVMHQLMHAYPLASMVVLTDDGLVANHIPFFLSEVEGEFGMLRGHVARSNPIWQRFKPECEALIIFSGAQHYITPSWYPTKKDAGKAVPTWNYAVVHAHGHVQVLHESAWIRSHLEELTNRNKSTIDSDWQVSDAPADYIERMMGMIVGIEIPIARLEGKWKVSHNQPAQNRDGVIQGLKALSGVGCPMAGLVEAYKDK